MKKRIYKLLPLIIGLLIINFLLHKLLVVRKVECRFNNSNCTEELERIAGKIVGSSLLSPIPESEIKNYFSQVPKVENVVVETKFPFTKIISLSQRVPVGALSSDISGSNALLVDGNGVVIGPANDTNYPLLIITNLTPETKTVSLSNIIALKVLYSINKLVSSRVIGMLDVETITATYPNGPKIIIDITTNEEKWYFPLQQILERSKISSKKPATIDLRFTNPVITY